MLRFMNAEILARDATETCNWALGHYLDLVVATAMPLLEADTIIIHYRKDMVRNVNYTLILVLSPDHASVFSMRNAVNLVTKFNTQAIGPSAGKIFVQIDPHDT